MPEAPIATTAGVYAEDRRLLEAFAPGVTWPAFIGGAFAAAALSLTLLALGSGFGFASVSPWSRDDISSDDSGVVDRGAMAGIGCGRLYHRSAADQMGWLAHARSVLS